MVEDGGKRGLYPTFQKCVQMWKQYFKALKLKKQKFLIFGGLAFCSMYPNFGKLWFKMVHGPPRGALWGGGKGDFPLPGKLGKRPPPPLEKLGAQEERAGTL